MTQQMQDDSPQPETIPDPSAPPPEQQEEAQDIRGTNLADLVIGRLRLMRVIDGKDEEIATKIREDLAPAILDRVRRYDLMLRRHVAQTFAAHANAMCQTATEAAGGAIKYDVIAVDAAAEMEERRRRGQEEIARAVGKVVPGRPAGAMPI